VIEPVQSEKANTIIQRRPLPTPAQVKTFAQAMFTAKRVAPGIVEQRIAICRQCDKRRVTPQGVEWCRNCGCKVSSKSKEIMNLAAYEENLPKWGCKHPQRKNGEGWEVQGSAFGVAGGSGQTTGSFSQTAGSSGQLAKGFVQTHGSSVQTFNFSGQLAGSFVQTSGTSGQTAGSSGQLSGSSIQTPEGSGQVSGRSGQPAVKTG